jgi:hypothetical protein
MTTKPALRVRWNRSNDEGWGHWGGVAVSKKEERKGHSASSKIRKRRSKLNLNQQKKNHWQQETKKKNKGERTLKKRMSDIPSITNHTL